MTTPILGDSPPRSAIGPAQLKCPRPPQPQAPGQAEGRGPPGPRAGPCSAATKRQPTIVDIVDIACIVGIVGIARIAVVEVIALFVSVYSNVILLANRAPR